MNHLNSPHGGVLVDPMVDTARARQIKDESRGWPSWDLTPRQLCDLELLLNGAFSPLRGFLGRADHESVCASMRLADGTLWPLPVLLDVGEAVAAGLAPGGKLALRDPEGVLLAALTVDEVWPLDREAVAQAAFGTLDRTHPGVAHLLDETHPVAVGGRLEGVQAPPHYDFVQLRHTPAELRAHFARLGWRRIVAFQTRNPLHRAHVELTQRAARDIEANLLIHPVVGMTKPGDVDHYTRVRCYQAVLARYPLHTVALSLLPLAMRMGGPREALLHAIIRKNYGCTALHRRPRPRRPGQGLPGASPFYGPYDAQELLAAHQDELGVTMVPFRNMVYVEELDAYQPEDEVAEGRRALSLSGTELRQRPGAGARAARSGSPIPEVAGELRAQLPAAPPAGLHGLLHRALRRRQVDPRQRPAGQAAGGGRAAGHPARRRRRAQEPLLGAGLLQGAPRHQHPPHRLRRRRDHQERRHRASAPPSPPTTRVRREVREMIRPGGGFVLVHVATPIEVCEQRDRKGLYAKARAGLIAEFTGISDPYEEPTDADVTLDTAEITPEEGAQRILLHLEHEGYIGAGGGAS